AELGGGQTEDANGCCDHRVALGWPTADGVVLSEDDPPLLAGVTKPDLVGQELGAFLSVDVRHREDRQSRRPQTLDDALAEAAVDEEFRRLFSFASHRRRLSDAARV